MFGSTHPVFPPFLSTGKWLLIKAPAAAAAVERKKDFALMETDSGHGTTPLFAQKKDSKNNGTKIGQKSTSAGRSGNCIFVRFLYFFVCARRWPRR